MVPSSAPQELSNEWSCQQVFTIFNITIGPKELKERTQRAVLWWRELLAVSRDILGGFIL
jgi:hypothetical protein